MVLIVTDLRLQISILKKANEAPENLWESDIFQECKDILKGWFPLELKIILRSISLRTSQVQNMSVQDAKSSWKLMNYILKYSVLHSKNHIEQRVFVISGFNKNNKALLTMIWEFQTLSWTPWTFKTIFCNLRFIIHPSLNSRKILRLDVVTSSHYLKVILLEVIWLVSLYMEFLNFKSDFLYKRNLWYF